MPIDVDLARSITPGVQHVCHLNNAGAALPTQPVLDAMFGYLRRESEIGGYEVEAEASATIEAVYDSVARLLCARRDEIALMESASSAWNAAFASIRFQPGDRILTGRSEYVSNALNLLLTVERSGAEIVVVDDDEHGQISLGGLRDAIDERTKLIALTHVATSGGLVNPAAAVGRIAREAGVLYLLDACQSAGQRPLDVDEIGCDMLSATGRKFLRGPRGTGFLYVRSSVVDSLQPFQLDPRSAVWTSSDTYSIQPGARRFESFESNIATRIGLGTAVDEALALGLDEIAARTTGLAAQLRTMLTDIPGVAVHDKGLDRCGIVTFTIEGVEPNDAKQVIAGNGINVTLTGPTSAQFDLPQRGLGQLVRASPHYYNTEDELIRLTEVVATMRG